MAFPPGCGLLASAAIFSRMWLSSMALWTSGGERVSTNSQPDGDSCQEEMANITWSLEEEWDSPLDVKKHRASRSGGGCGKDKDREGRGWSGGGGTAPVLRQWEFGDGDVEAGPGEEREEGREEGRRGAGNRPGVRAARVQ